MADDLVKVHDIGVFHIHIKNTDLVGKGSAVARTQPLVVTPVTTIISTSQADQHACKLCPKEHACLCLYYNDVGIRRRELGNDGVGFRGDLLDPPTLIPQTPFSAALRSENPITVGTDEVGIFKSHASHAVLPQSRFEIENHAFFQGQIEFWIPRCDVKGLGSYANAMAGVRIASIKPLEPGFTRFH